MFYGITHRTVFALGLAWLIFACHAGYGGFINKLLSLKPWFFLANLSYSSYLFHAVCIIGTYLWSPFPIRWTGHGMQMAYFIVQVVFCYATAITLAFCIETPPLNIERIFLSRGKSETKDRENVTEKMVDSGESSSVEVISSGSDHSTSDEVVETASSSDTEMTSLRSQEVNR